MAELTDAVIDRALAKGREAALTEPRAASARYEASGRRMIVELTNGCTFAFPADLAQGLDGAGDADLAAVEILGNGYGRTGRASTSTSPCPTAWPASSAPEAGWPAKPAAPPPKPRPKPPARTTRKAADRDGRRGGKNVKEGSVPLSWKREVSP